jgi:hypothetical protein
MCAGSGSWAVCWTLLPPGGRPPPGSRGPPAGQIWTFQPDVWSIASFWYTDNLQWTQGSPCCCSHCPCGSMATHACPNRYSVWIHAASKMHSALHLPHFSLSLHPGYFVVVRGSVWAWRASKGSPTGVLQCTSCAGRDEKCCFVVYEQVWISWDGTKRVEYQSTWNG